MPAGRRPSADCEFVEDGTGLGVLGADGGQCRDRPVADGVLQVTGRHVAAVDEPVMRWLLRLRF